MNRVSNEDVQNRIKENITLLVTTLKRVGLVTRSGGMLTTILEGKNTGTDKVTRRLRMIDKLHIKKKNYKGLKTWNWNNWERQ